MARVFPLILAATLGLTGCSKSSLSTFDTEAPQILGVDPREGPLTGGTVVTVSGVGLDGDLAVWFDNQPIAYQSLDELSLTLTTPPRSAQGAVDIKVVNEVGESVLAGAYTYSDGSPTDTGPTDTGTGVGEDIGGLLQFVHTQVVCPDCFPGWYTNDVDVLAEAVLHEPSPDGWVDWWPEPGACINNPIATVPSVQRLDAGQWMYLTTGGVQLQLPRQQTADGPKYLRLDLTTTDFVHPVYFDLTAPGGDDIGEIAITDAVLTPAGFSTIEPIQMLMISPAESFTAPFSRTLGQTITWSPTGPGTMYLQMLVFSANGATQLGTVFCQEYDGGAMHVPAANLAQYPAGSALAVYLYRSEVGTAPIPATGDLLQYVSQMGILGTGTITN